MAKPPAGSSEKSLAFFSASLEDLTFNSKPIIDELTKFAGSYRRLAPQIVQKVEKRILEVCPEWKLPSLYLLDSILKNIKGDYIELTSKIVVHIFCHCFEKLADADSRKALYKLRQTWTVYYPNRKLALIDKHVKAIDPNWPVTAVEDDPPSPTIFVNPKFLESKEQSSGSTSTTAAASRNTRSAESSSRSERQATEAPPPKRVVSPPATETKRPNNKQMTIQEKRKRLLQEKQTQKKKQQEAMGLSPENHLRAKKEHKRSGGRSGSSSPGRRSASPLMVPSPHNRSVSPLTVAERSPQRKAVTRHQTVQNAFKEITPPPEKRPKLEPKTEPGMPPSSDSSAKESTKLRRSRSPMEVTPSKEDKMEALPLKESHLQLNDLPPELLPKHHELVLKQIETQLSTGNLSSEQHNTLRKQLDQLYELQKMKEGEGSTTRDKSPSAEQSSQKQTSVPSEEFISLTDTKSDSTFFVDTHGSNDNFERGGRHDCRGRPRPHFERHPDDRYSRPPPRGYRGEPRPPYRGRRGPYRRPPRGAPGRYFDEFDGPPPPMGPGRGPPPPHWREHPPQGGRGYRRPGPPPGRGPTPPPVTSGPLDVSNLFSQLVDAGMIDSGQKSGPAPQQSRRQDGPRRSPPLAVPTLSFTVGTLKQRYSALISLLHVGEQCSTCGMRFKDLSGDEYRVHLDWHYSLNRNEGQVNTSRNWFIHPEDWLKFEESTEETQEKEPTLKPSVETQEEEEVNSPKGYEAVTSCQVLSGEDSEVCNICQEPLEQFWEEDLEEWHFKDATRSAAGRLYHMYCFQDVKEEELNISNNSSKQPASPL